MLATSLNLLPGGQLDGGHIIFSIAPRAHKFVSRTDDSNSSAHGVLPVDGMVDVGHPAVVEQLSSSASSGVAASFRRANMAGGICTVHACGHSYAGADGAFFRGRGREPQVGVSGRAIVVLPAGCRPRASAAQKTRHAMKILPLFPLFPYTPLFNRFSRPNEGGLALKRITAYLALLWDGFLM